MKFLLIPVLAIMSMNTFAVVTSTPPKVEVCILTQNGPSATYSYYDCSDQDQNKALKKKSLTVQLKKLLEAGYKINSTVIDGSNSGYITYTLIKQ